MTHTEILTRLLHVLVLLPFAGYVLNIFLPKKMEKLISGTTFFTIGLHFVIFLVFGALWMYTGHPTINIKDIILFQSGDYEFYIDFTFDKITVVYMFVGSFLTFLVTIYCSY